MPEALSVFKALADPSRLRIVRSLESGSLNVGELCEVLEMGQSRVSRHLKILADAGLVRSRREGSWVYYSLPRAGEVRGLRRCLLDALAGEEPPAAEDRTRALEVLERRAARAHHFFEEVAPEWEQFRRRHLGDQDHLPRFKESIPEAEVLADLGTGNGELLLDLAGRVRQGIGVDRSERMLSEAERRRAAREVENVEFRLGTLEHLPLRDGEADASVAHMVLHYVADPPAVLHEIRRALRPGGTLHVAELCRHEQEWMRETLEHHCLGFDPDELEGWLQEAGFEDLTIQTLDRPGEAPDVVLARGRRRT